MNAKLYVFVSGIDSSYRQIVAAHSLIEAEKLIHRTVDGTYMYKPVFRGCVDRIGIFRDFPPDFRDFDEEEECTSPSFAEGC